MNAKTKAILSHVFLIGWVIALVINMNDKEEYASFYIRQNLGIMIVGVMIRMVATFPYLGPPVAAICGVVLFIFWLMSLIWAIQGEMKPLPWFGKIAQDWFKAL